jgi:hypothetical protein
MHLSDYTVFFTFLCDHFVSFILLFSYFYVAFCHYENPVGEFDYNIVVNTNNIIITLLFVCFLT